MLGDLGEVLDRRYPDALARSRARVKEALPGGDALGDDIAEAWSVVAAVCDDLDRTAVAAREISLGPEGRMRLTQRVFDEIFRAGPVQPMLDDPNYTDVTIRGPRKGWAHRADGTKVSWTPGFADTQDLVRWIKRMVERGGHTIDEAHPSATVDLPEGRLHAVIPPASWPTSEPLVTIRCMRLEVETLDDAVHNATLAREAAEFLAAAVRAKENILIAGGGGSGKTTTANALGREIPERERVVTIQELQELRLEAHHPDVNPLFVREANLEGKGARSIEDNIRDAVKMSADRIIVGEIVTSADAAATLRAMNTGHEGSLTTFHANSATRALDGLVALLGREGWPVEAAARYVHFTIGLVVQMRRRLEDGRRRDDHRDRRGGPVRAVHHQRPVRAPQRGAHLRGPSP